MARYVLDRGYPFVDEISAERARQIYEHAAANPEARLEGSFEEGFTYASSRWEGVELLRIAVRPVQDDGIAGSAR